MDRATFIGIIIGVVAIFYGVLGSSSWSLIEMYTWFFNVPSISIVLGGTLASTMIYYPLPQVLALIPITRNIFTTSAETPTEAIETIVSLAEKARREGLLSLEADVEAQENTFLKKGIQLGVDYSLTHSCYDPSPQGFACGRCDSCFLRKKGFKEAGIEDPTKYI